MKYIATKGLTSAYLQKLGRQNNFATGGTVLVVTVSLLWTLFHAGGDHTIDLFSDTIYTLGSLMGASWAWITSYRARRGALHFLRLLTALVGIVVAVRYLLTTYDNELLLQERERQLQETEQLYQHLQTAHQHLRELDQLKDQFLMTASHELRTPLTSVQGYLGLMAQFHDQLPPERLWEYLQKAQRSCDVLVILLSNIMDASRLELEAGMHPAHLEHVSVQDMMQSVINLIEPRVTQEQREVHLHIPPHLHVRADAGQLCQVLLNISMNALKYSPPRTPIAFSAQVATDFNSEVIISVTDKGQGIALRDQARIFQRFVRLGRDMNSSVQGSGLGLYISYHLVEAMGGKIWIESKGIPGEGTTFHIQLSKA